MADLTEDRPPTPEEDGGGEVKSFLEHLEDLRWTLIKAGVALVLAMLICLVGGNWVFWILERPLLKSKAPVKLVFMDPAGPFISSLHVAFFGGMVLAAPFIFYYVFQFILPALKINEKKYFMRAVAFGSCLFVLGVCACYFGVMPLALNATFQYANWLLGDQSAAHALNACRCAMGANGPELANAATPLPVEWRAEQYASFTSKFMIGMGLGFELPVLLLTLVKIGILDYRKLASMRRYMIVICLVLGALLTTPEVLTQVVMAVPLYGLYELSVLIAWYWERQERRKQQAAGS